MKITVCWMLTENDGGPDGGRLAYLQKPARWKDLDPDLYDYLQDSLARRKIRDIRTIMDCPLLKAVRFYPPQVPHESTLRAAYFDALRDCAAGSDLVFFDPDNGVERAQIPQNGRRAVKHLYWDELVSIFKQNHSVMFYQSYPRLPRDEFIERVAGDAGRETGSPEVYSFRTPYFALFLAAQSRHRQILGKCLSDQERWKKQIQVRPHSVAQL